MGDVSDWLKNQNLMTGTANDIAADVEGVINSFSTVGAAIEAGTLVLQALGVLGSDDTKKKIDTLVTLFGYLFEVLQGDFNVWRMDQVGTQYDHVLTQLQHLDEHKGDLNYLKANSFDLDNNSLDPLNQLADDKSWVRPLFPQGVYNDVFSGNLEPPGSHGPGSIVFDYRLTLSAFLYAIAGRITILWALAQVDPHYQDIAKTEASRYASILLGRYAQMWAGIVSIRAVTFQELQQCIAAATPPIPAIGSAVSFWYLANRPYGDVDTYSTVAVISQFPTDQIPFLNQNAFPEVLQAMYNKFFFRYWMGTLARWKRVYGLMGLSNLKAIINHLKAIAGEPPVQPTLPDTCDWSLLEAEHATPESIYPRHGQLSVVLHVGDWVKKSFGNSVWPGAPILGQPSVSVRRTFENFADLH
jgi:hypothetical protein